MDLQPGLDLRIALAVAQHQAANDAGGNLSHRQQLGDVFGARVGVGEALDQQGDLFAGRGHIHLPDQFLGVGRHV